MCNENGGVSLTHSHGDEEYEKGNTRDDVGVEHRDVVEEGHHLALASVEIVNAYGRHSSQHGGEQGCQNAYAEGVLNGLH